MAHPAGSASGTGVANAFTNLFSALAGNTSTGTASATAAAPAPQAAAPPMPPGAAPAAGAGHAGPAAHGLDPNAARVPVVTNGTLFNSLLLDNSGSMRQYFDMFKELVRSLPEGGQMQIHSVSCVGTCTCRLDTKKLTNDEKDVYIDAAMDHVGGTPLFTNMIALLEAASQRYEDTGMRTALFCFTDGEDSSGIPISDVTDVIRRTARASVLAVQMVSLDRDEMAAARQHGQLRAIRRALHAEDVDSRVVYADMHEPNQLKVAMQTLVGSVNTVKRGEVPAWAKMETQRQCVGKAIERKFAVKLDHIEAMTRAQVELLRRQGQDNRKAQRDIIELIHTMNAADPGVASRVTVETVVPPPPPPPAAGADGASARAAAEVGTADGDADSVAADFPAPLEEEEEDDEEAGVLRADPELLDDFAAEDVPEMPDAAFQGGGEDMGPRPGAQSLGVPSLNVYDTVMWREPAVSGVCLLVCLLLSVLSIEQWLLLLFLAGGAAHLLYADKLARFLRPAATRPVAAMLAGTIRAAGQLLTQDVVVDAVREVLQRVCCGGLRLLLWHTPSESLLAVAYLITLYSFGGIGRGRVLYMLATAGAFALPRAHSMFWVDLRRGYARTGRKGVALIVRSLDKLANKLVEAAPESVTRLRAQLLLLGVFTLHMMSLAGVFGGIARVCLTVVLVHLGSKLHAFALAQQQAEDAEVAQHED